MIASSKSMTTVGVVIKEKFNNFTRFCGTYLQLEPDAVQELQRVNELPPELLIAALRGVLLPCKEAIVAKDLDGLETQMKTVVADAKALQMLVCPFRAANADQEPRVWLYLNCFVELIE